MKNQTTLILLHGAGTGPWIWDRFRESVSLPCVAIDVPSRHSQATPKSCTDQIVQKIDELNINRLVLVLHSLSGVLASELASRLGDRLVSTVFVAAIVPAANQRFVDVMGFPTSLILKILFKFNKNGLKPSDSMLRAELCNDLASQEASFLIDRYQPEWPGLYLGRVQGAQSIQRPIYIRLTNDQSVSLKLQDQIIENLSHPTVMELDAGHMAMLSKPEALGKMIMEAVQSTS